MITNTPNILSRKTNKNPNETPIAKLDPVPPLLLIDDTERAIMVRIKQEKGMVYLLCLTNKWELINGEPAFFSYLISLLSSKKLSVSAT